MTTGEVAWAIGKTWLWGWLIFGIFVLLYEDTHDPLKRGGMAVGFGAAWPYFAGYVLLLLLGMGGEVARDAILRGWAAASPKLRDFRRDASFEVVCAWDRLKKAIQRRRAEWRAKRANG